MELNESPNLMYIPQGLLSRTENSLLLVQKHAISKTRNRPEILDGITQNDQERGSFFAFKNPFSRAHLITVSHVRL